MATNGWHERKWSIEHSLKEKCIWDIYVEEPIEANYFCIGVIKPFPFSNVFWIFRYVKCDVPE